MAGSRKFSPSEVLDEGWALVVLYLTLLPDASETPPLLACGLQLPAPCR
jgi:hypothetical protein